MRQMNPLGSWIVAIVAGVATLALAHPAEAQKARRVMRVGDLMVTPTISPDGRYVAYSFREPANGVHGLYVGRLGGKAKRVATGLGASFSPTSTRLVYWSDENGGADYELFLMEPSSGTGGTLGVKGKDPQSALPLFSNDGEVIVYVNINGTYVIPAVGQVTKKVSSRTMTNPQWSPKMDKILFERRGGGLSWLDMNNGRITDITPNFHGFDARWSPDGTKIAYAHEQGIWVLDLATKKKKRIIDGSKVEWTNYGEGLVVLWEDGTQTKTRIGPVPDYRAYWLDLKAIDKPKELIAKCHLVEVTADGRRVVFFTHNQGIYVSRLKKLPGEAAAKAAAEKVRSGSPLPTKANIKPPKSGGRMPDADTLKAIR